VSGWWELALAAVLFPGGCALFARGLLRASISVAVTGLLIGEAAAVPMAFWSAAHLG